MSNPNDLVITRTFDASPGAVFDAWTVCRDFKQWWGPEDYTCPSCDIDARVRGKALSCMRSSDGKEFWTGGEFKEFRRPDKLIITNYFSDQDGNLRSPIGYGIDPSWPNITLITLTFEDDAGKTKMTMKQAPIPEGRLRKDCELGWNQAFDKLAALVSKKHVMSRG